MSDNISFELQLHIMKRLSVVSLIRCRSVSKAWKSLIDSSDFTANYIGKLQHLLVNYHHYTINDHKYVSIVDDHTFPQQKFSPTPPKLVTKLICSQIIGGSHGVLCLSGYYDYYPETKIAVLWNISVRKAVAVASPTVNDKGYLGLGFGVCPVTNDPKIVNITHVSREEDPKDITCIPWQVQVFNLSIGDWRSVYNNLPRNSVKLFRYPPVFVDRVLYWVATDKIAMDGGFRSCNLIVSFDITNEEFGQVNLPDTLALGLFVGNLRVSKIRDSLVVVEYGGDEKDPTFFVWMMMQDGDSKSLTKLFGIHTPEALTTGVLEFRKSGEPILEVAKHDYSWYDLCESRLAAYEPDSKQICNLGIDGRDFVFSASSYMETILLHDQPHFVVYDKGGVSSFYEWRSEKSRARCTS